MVKPIQNIKAGAVELKKRPPTRVLCARVKEIRSIFSREPREADASPKQKEGVKKHLLSHNSLCIFRELKKKRPCF